MGTRANDSIRTQVTTQRIRDQRSEQQEQKIGTLGETDMAGLERDKSIPARNSRHWEGGWRDGSVVKSSGCSSTEPEFNSQQPHGS